MGTISIRKVSSIGTPLAGRVNLAVKTDDILYMKDENGVETPVGGGSTLGGTHYIFVQGDGTDVENAQELQDAYDLAKTMSPSATNRITIIAAPGNYNFSSDFEMDEEYIDLVSLDGNRSVIFNGLGTISIFANNVFVKGVNALSKQIQVGSFLANTVIENCKGGEFSFGSFNVTLTSTFINCEGGNNSFASFDFAGGTFINCVGGNGSFAGNGGTASGTFTNCVGGDYSFGGSNSSGGVASGTFKDCIGGEESFGFEEVTGTFINCEAGDGSFGFSGELNGANFENCKSGELSFGSISLFVDSEFDNCIGGGESFGFDSSPNNQGKYYRCRLTDGTFDVPDFGGFVVLGIDGNNDVQNITGV